MFDSKIKTRSGAMVDLSDPQPSDIRIDDIAYSLARLVRFNGHSPGWNVAQHSIVVSQRSPPHLALEGLLHDAAEAYVGDVTRPLKQMLGKAYKDIETKVETAITVRYGLIYPWPVEIKKIDDDMCQSELSCFWPADSESTEYQPVDASTAESMFIAVFTKLVLARAGLPT